MRGGVGGQALYFLLVLVLAVPTASAAHAHRQESEAAPALLTDHPPILIDGDGAFTPANGVTSGTGTATDPFILENWTISARDRTGIEVRNTRVAFTIRHVDIMEGWDRSQRGIIWQNVSNARLEGSNLSRNYHGLEIAAGSNLTLADNRVEASAFYGIWLERSNKTTLIRNTIANASAQGIFIRDAFDVLVTDNDIRGNGVGILVASSMEVRIYGNRIVGSLDYPANDLTGGNAWDAGYPRGGNFWSEYNGWDDCSGPAQNVCPESDGIGDRSFEFAPSRWDFYPLLPVNPPNQLPVAAFEITGSRLPGEYVTFNARTSQDPDGFPLTRYAWDFGDGAQTAGPDIQVAHSFAPPGTYIVSLTVTDVRGGTGTATASVSIQPPPGPEPLVLRSYEHPSAGFRLPVPEGWTIQEDVTRGNVTIELILLGPLNGGTQTNILVETDSDPTVRETDAYLRATVDETLTGIRQANPTTSVDLMEGPTLRTIGDHAAATFKLQYGTGQLFQTIAIVVSEPHQRYWILILTTDGQSYGIMDEGFERMLAGFVITRAPPPSEPTVTPGVTLAGIPLFLLLGGGIVFAVLVVVLVAVLLIRRRKPMHPPPPSLTPWSAPAGPALWTPPPATVPRFCTSCGSALPIGASFCGRCGVALPPPPPTM